MIRAALRRWLGIDWVEHEARSLRRSSDLLHERCDASIKFEDQSRGRYDSLKILADSQQDRINDLHADLKRLATRVDGLASEEWGEPVSPRWASFLSHAGSTIQLEFEGSDPSRLPSRAPDRVTLVGIEGPLAVGAAVEKVRAIYPASDIVIPFAIRRTEAGK